LSLEDDLATITGNMYRNFMTTGMSFLSFADRQTAIHTRSLQYFAVLGRSIYFKCLHFITFRVSRRRREMYCGHAHLCVCLSLCPRPHAHTIARPGCNLGEW